MATKPKRRKPLNRRARFPTRKWEREYSRALEPKLTAYGKRLVQHLDDKGVIRRFSEYLLKKYGSDDEVRSAVRRYDFDPVADLKKLEKLASNYLSGVSVNIEPIVEKYTKDIFAAGSKHAFGKLGANAVWSLKSPHVERAIERRVNKIKDASDFQAKRVLVAIRKEVYENGGHPLSSANLQKVKNAMGEIGEDRARTIARTEAAAVHNDAARTVYAENGILQKEWLYSGSGYERHMGLAGEVVGIDDEFSNGCKYPGDPDADPGESVNCMCTLMPVTSDFNLDLDELVTE